VHLGVALSDRCEDPSLPVARRLARYASLAAVATQSPRKAESSSPPNLECSDVTAAQSAEDRGFEPRRVLPPNRISSAFPLVPGRSGQDRDRPEWQASRAGNAGLVPGPAADARRVRTRTGHTHSPDAGHRGSWSTAAMVPAMRPIVARAMPASRCTSLVLRPASIAARTTSPPG